MKNFKAIMKIQTMMGLQTREVAIKAKTEAVALKKAWQIAGNQSVESIQIIAG